MTRFSFIVVVISNVSVLYFPSGAISFVEDCVVVVEVNYVPEKHLTHKHYMPDNVETRNGWMSVTVCIELRLQDQK